MEELTPRETEVLKLIASGDSGKEIAAKLGITFRTARCHRSNLMEKIGAHETASLVRYAIRAGLIQA
jgi:DNA-binding NarL/FixJ family response regulator